MHAPGLLNLLVMTFNIWGLPKIGHLVPSPLRAARVAAICEELVKGRADIVLLQEVWVNQDRLRLKNCGYGYSADRDESFR